MSLARGSGFDGLQGRVRGLDGAGFLRRCGWVLELNQQEEWDLYQGMDVEASPGDGGGSQRWICVCLCRRHRGTWNEKFRARGLTRKESVSRGMATWNVRRVSVVGHASWQSIRPQLIHLCSREVATTASPRSDFSTHQGQRPL